MTSLAVTGGSPVSRLPWPAWPAYDDATIEAVSAAVRSGRWTVTGGWTGQEPYERLFAARFADFVGVPYCVSTDHGASALILALEALNVGPGDEVVVPVLTWVATATAVLAVNAVPVFADVDETTGCLSAATVEPVLTERTRAVIPVHLHCRMADMDELGRLARRHEFALVEDCAQAHGARWSGRVAGSLGDVGAFSMQQGKVLTCGEGGAVTTRSASTYDRLQQLRADSRRYRDSPPELGHPLLTDVGGVMGSNMLLGELAAALLLDQLDRLEPQLERRAANAELLDERLALVEGLEPLRRDARLERPSVFEYAVRRTAGSFGGSSTDEVCRAVGAELGLRVMRTDQPLHQSVLYCPETKARFTPVAGRARPPEGSRFPSAEALYDDLVLLPHRALLADSARMDEVVTAFVKVARCPPGL